MRATTVSSKGQVTIPAELVRALKIKPGTKLLVIPVQDGLLLMRRPRSLTNELAGSLGDVYGDADSYVEAERSGWS